MISHNSEVEVFFFFLPGLHRFYQRYSFIFCVCLTLFLLEKKLSEYKVNILQLQKVLKI